MPCILSILIHLRGCAKIYHFDTAPCLLKDIWDHRTSLRQLQEKKFQPALPSAVFCHSVHPLVVILSVSEESGTDCPPCHSEPLPNVIPSLCLVSFRAAARNLFRRSSETVSLDMEPVRRGVAGLTPLRIKRQFSTNRYLLLDLLHLPIPEKSASSLAEADGGWEICAGDP